MMLPVQPFTAHSSSQQQLSSPVGTAAQHNRCATHSKRGTIRPLCASTRHASTPSTTDRGTTLSTISQHWYADYHGVVQRLERLYWQRVGQRDVEQADDNVLAVQLNEPSTSSASSTTGGGGGGGKDDDFYVNAGVAIRTLREDIPQLFQQDLDYDIYREDIVFRDPRNVFRGIKNYRTIFWSLRFHGRIFFRHLYVEILSIWQPEDKQVKMRWKVHGVPRVPWETEGTFNGISTFRLDSHGKVYEHQVDNVIFRDNPPLRLPIFARINLVPGAVSNGGQPCPGACTERRPAAGWWLSGFSWYRLYAAMLLSLATSTSTQSAQEQR